MDAQRRSRGGAKPKTRRVLGRDFERPSVHFAEATSATRGGEPHVADRNGGVQHFVEVVHEVVPHLQVHRDNAVESNAVLSGQHIVAAQFNHAAAQAGVHDDHGSDRDALRVGDWGATVGGGADPDVHHVARSVALARVERGADVGGRDADLHDHGLAGLEVARVHGGEAAGPAGRIG